VEGEMHLEGLDVTFGELEVDSLSATKRDGRWTVAAMAKGVLYRLSEPTLEKALEEIVVRVMASAEARRLKATTTNTEGHQ
jgi:hypothetical protein